MEVAHTGDGNSHRQTVSLLDALQPAMAQSDRRPQTRSSFVSQQWWDSMFLLAYQTPCRSISVVLSRGRRRRHTPMRVARSAFDHHDCRSTSQQFMW